MIARPVPPIGPHAAVAYLGQSARAGAAYRCDRCGAHWYPDMGERPPSRCDPTPDALRRLQGPLQG